MYSGWLPPTLLHSIDCAVPTRYMQQSLFDLAQH